MRFNRDVVIANWKLFPISRWTSPRVTATQCLEVSHETNWNEDKIDLFKFNIFEGIITTQHSVIMKQGSNEKILSKCINNQKSMFSIAYVFLGNLISSSKTLRSKEHLQCNGYFRKCSKILRILFVMHTFVESSPLRQYEMTYEVFFWRWTYEVFF